MKLFEKYLIVFAKLTECFANSYGTRDEIEEILTKSNIKHRNIDIGGSATNKWWNVMQYLFISEKMGKIDKLIAISYEDNPNSKCISSVKQYIINLNSAENANQSSDSGPYPGSDIYSGNPSVDKDLPMGNMGNIYMNKSSGISGEVDLSGVTQYKNYAKKQVRLNNSRGMEVSGNMKVFENPILMRILTKEKKDQNDLKNINSTLLTRLRRSLAVGLVYNAQSKSYCTGFLIAKDIVVLPSFIIKNMEEVYSLKFMLRNPFQNNKEHYAFDFKPVFYEANNQTMLLRLEKSIDAIKPLKLAIGGILKKIKGDDMTLINFSQTDKKVMSFSRLEVEKDGYELSYDTDLEPGSAGGPILIDGYVIGMHCSMAENGRKKGINLIRFGE